MPTIYNVHFMASHDLTMAFKVPPGNVVAHKVEMALRDLGLEPTASTVERNDDVGELKFESKAWVAKVPAALLMGVAQYFDDEYNNRTNPDSEKWNPKFATGEPIDMVDLAKVLIEERAK